MPDNFHLQSKFMTDQTTDSNHSLQFTDIAQWVLCFSVVVLNADVELVIPAERPLVSGRAFYPPFQQTIQTWTERRDLTTQTDIYMVARFLSLSLALVFGWLIFS